MKTRSSSGVGQKVDLEFDVDSLRIRDMPEDAQNNKKPSGNLYESIKRQSAISNADTAPTEEPVKVTADVHSSKLKQMLAQIKKTS